MAWEEKEDALYRSFIFADFSEAFAFMVRVAMVAERQNHHPTWKNTWNKVEIWLNTHDKGYKITDADRKLSASIDRLLVE